MTPVQRAARKSMVFHIMYGYSPQATETEAREWRKLAADFINGLRDDCPLSLQGFRAQRAIPAGK